ncbi:MAG: Gfo/Idh/MocA family oxidoreductase [Tissierellia bacterium]|nr:Gfo/Idh/MocA family oxidoreductase [Tissierellia bacterium]
MKKLNVGMIGAGFAARLHSDSIKRIAGMDIDLVSVADTKLESAKQIANIYGYYKYTDNYKEVLQDTDIDVVILATPPSTHLIMTTEAMEAGKHVICEKPLTGYFGMPNDKKPIGIKVSKEKMYNKVLADIKKLRNTIKNSNQKFMYAENYIYSPNIQKAAEIINKKKSTILFMKGEESVQGSPSSFASSWEDTGGGTLLRIGCHPLGGILYLKNIEAKTKGIDIKVKSVVADIGSIATTLTSEKRKYLRANPLDVEDFGTMTITFTDNTKATIFANDNVLGGVKNYIEIYTNDSSLICNITPTDELKTYFIDQEDLEDVYISEKLENKTGWNKVFVSESIKRGYVNQMQDFLECVAYDKQPISSFEIAAETTKILYAAYVSASEGRRVYL